MDVKTGWGWQQESLCIWSRWLPNAAKKKKKTLNEHFLSVRTQMCLHAHISKQRRAVLHFFSLSFPFVFVLRLSFTMKRLCICLSPLARSLAPRKFIDIHWTQQRVLRPSGTLRSETVCVCSSLSSSVISIVILYQ